MQKQLFRTRLTDVADTDIEGVGTTRYEDDGKVYRWVKNAESTIGFAAGNVVTHKFTDTSNAYKNVYQALTANLGLLAGVVLATSFAAGKYGWVQCLGENADCDVFASQTTVKTAGDFLKGVNAATYLDADATMGTAPTHRRGIQLLEAIATTTPGVAVSKKVYIFCL